MRWYIWKFLVNFEGLNLCIDNTTLCVYECVYIFVVMEDLLGSFLVQAWPIFCGYQFSLYRNKIQGQITIIKYTSALLFTY